jgi:hypothetical protein
MSRLPPLSRLCGTPRASPPPESGEDRARVEGQINDLRDALKTEDTNRIKKATIAAMSMIVLRPPTSAVCALSATVEPPT